jgi:hypothetical protein
MKEIKSRIIVLIVFLFLGCGYSFQGFRYEEDKIFIYPVINKINITSEKRRYSSYQSFPILLEKKLTNKLIEKFNINSHLKVVNTLDSALRLSCTIKNYLKESLRYTDSEEVEEQRLRLYVHIQLKDSKGALLKEKDIIGETTYFLVGRYRKSEEEAQKDLIEDTARRILEAIVEEW